jgi:hypothetical protein
MSINDKKYLQYDCGLTGPVSWLNYDASPMIRLKKIPIIGKIIENKRGGGVFSENVLYGNIVK